MPKKKRRTNIRVAGRDYAKATPRKVVLDAAALAAENAGTHETTDLAKARGTGLLRSRSKRRKSTGLNPGDILKGLRRARSSSGTNYQKILGVNLPGLGTRRTKKKK